TAAGIALASDVTLIERVARHGGSAAHAALTLIVLRAGVAVVACGAVGGIGVRARASRGGARSRDLAFIPRHADHRIAARTHAAPPLVVLLAGAAVAAGRAVGGRRIRARARREVARPGGVALILRRAAHRISARAHAVLTGVGLRAGIVVVARGPVGAIAGIH